MIGEKQYQNEQTKKIQSKNGDDTVNENGKKVTEMTIMTEARK